MLLDLTVNVRLSMSLPISYADLRFFKDVSESLLPFPGPRLPSDESGLDWWREWVETVAADCENPLLRGSVVKNSSSDAPRLMSCTRLR